MGGLKSAGSQITSIKITFSNDKQKEDFREPSLGHPPERRHAMGYAHTSSTTFVAGRTGVRPAAGGRLFAGVLCYLLFYTGRQTFGFAIPGIQKEFGLSKEMLGWVSSAMLWAYAIGQAINGNLADKYGGRRITHSTPIPSSFSNLLFH